MLHTVCLIMNCRRQVTLPMLVRDEVLAFLLKQNFLSYQIGGIFGPVVGRLSTYDHLSIYIP